MAAAAAAAAAAVDARVRRRGLDRGRCGEWRRRSLAWCLRERRCVGVGVGGCSVGFGVVGLGLGSIVYILYFVGGGHVGVGSILYMWYFVVVVVFSFSTVHP